MKTGTPALRLFDDESIDEDHAAQMNKVIKVLLDLMFDLIQGPLLTTYWGQTFSSRTQEL